MSTAKSLLVGNLEIACVEHLKMEVSRGSVAETRFTLEKNRNPLPPYNNSTVKKIEITVLFF